MRSLVITVFVVGCGLAAWAMDNPDVGVVETENPVKSVGSAARLLAEIKQISGYRRRKTR